MVKVKGSTLIEVLIAMVILATSFAVGTMIFLNVTNKSSNYVKTQAMLSLEEEYIAITRGSKRSKKEFDRYSIQTNTRPSTYKPLVELHLSAIARNGDTLATSIHLIKP